MALIAGFALEMGRFEGYVADFEDADRYGVVFILSERFEQPGKERGADDLVFCCLGVGEYNSCLLVIHAVKMGEVFSVRAEDEGHDF